ncbi:MAG: glycosyltransferase family 2 protein [Armatimonadetes bacterium]|nr:glycosyltransferase family 2 protein [Armatimonadota bacterium]MBS1711480.1 glycosyltransferase family 2 protein [Armatimonadota bacterium]MBX3107595.1 glycosyltransferase family 2 protein [Fimbriimonadaceae bacterium]
MVDIVVVNWNTREKLRACLASLQVQSMLPSRVIVVDNASTDGSAEMVRTEFPGVELLAQEVNLGYAKGNNLGLKSAKSEYILLLNPDTELPDDNLAAATACLASHRDCGAMSVKFIGPDGEVQRSVRGFPTILGVLGMLTGLDRRFPSGPLGSYSLPGFDYARSQLAPQPMGTYLLFRRSVLGKFCDPESPFDEDFPIYFNEVDLLYRMQLAGFHCWYESNLSIFHHHGASTKQARKSMIWESHLSLIRYFDKHATGIRRLALPAIAAASVAGAIVRSRGFSRGFAP